MDILKLESWIRVDSWPKEGVRLPRMQAHRGYWLEGQQENTLGAFRMARNRGALMIECDVRLSRDGLPVVFHDEETSRFSSIKKCTHELSAAELKDLVGAPTLEEVLRDPLVPRMLNIELKSKKLVDDPLERKVAEVVRSLSAQNRVLFSSFNPMSLVRISLHLPHIPRALIVSEEDAPENPWVLRKMVSAPILPIHALHLDYRMYSADRARIFKNNRVPIVLWTVNDISLVQRFHQMGAISIISDQV